MVFPLSFPMMTWAFSLEPHVWAHSRVVRGEFKISMKACVICLIALSVLGRYESMNDISNHKIFKMMIWKGGEGNCKGGICS